MPENSETCGRDADVKRQIARPSVPQGLVSLILNAVAGWVDAVGYLALLSSIQMFSSFMSGNLTKIVTEAVSGNGATSLKIAGAVLAFFAGGVVGLCALSGHRFTVAIGDSKGHESVGIEFNAV